MEWQGGASVAGWVSTTNAAKLNLNVNRLTAITVLNITGNSVITGTLPPLITCLYFNGDTINWIYSSVLPSTIITLFINSVLVNFTGLNLSGKGNITTFSLLNYRIAKMSSADMVTLLTSLVFDFLKFIYRNKFKNTI